jgi:hypothetical protein
MVNVDGGAPYALYFCAICDDAMDKLEYGEDCFIEGDLALSVAEAGLDLNQPVVQ